MDWNNDGRKDLITGENNGHIRIYLNTGSDANPVFTTYSLLQVAGTTFSTSFSIPEVVDWNNDGKKDLLVGNSSGYVMLLLNTGTDASPSFSAATYITNGSVPLVASSRASAVAAAKAAEPAPAKASTSAPPAPTDRRGERAEPVLDFGLEATAVAPHPDDHR